MGAQVSRIEEKLTRLEASHGVQVEHNNAQMALLRGQLTERMGENLKYMALSIGFSTIVIVATVFVAVFFAMPAAG